MTVAMIDQLEGPSIAGSLLEQQCANYTQMKMQMSLERASILTNESNQQNYLANRPEALGGLAAADALPVTRLMLNYFQEPSKRLESTLDYYTTNFWAQNGDERSIQMPFMSAGPWKLISATLIYLYLIKVFLPRFMRNRKPFELNWPIRIYNLLMVFSNLLGFYHGARILNFGTKCFGCEIIDSKDYSPTGLELLHYGWLFVLSRLVEWLDTIFFVLRKKDRQVTKLHVFHHSFVPIFSWVYLKFWPGYTVAFFPFVNSFVHTIMYNYYFLATFGARLQPYLWWKKYLTSLQIAQFVLILIQLVSIPLTMNEQCQYPLSFLIVAFAGAFLFLWLFYTYYLDTYKKPEQTNAKTNINKQAELKNCKSVERRTTTTTRNVNDQTDRQVKFARDGSSRALSDSIDNAIVCETDLAKKLV